MKVVEWIMVKGMVGVRNKGEGNGKGKGKGKGKG